MIQRNGELVINMLPNVQQQTIKPYIEATIVLGSIVYTDEYDIYHRLTEWGYEHHTVNHSAGEYARDEDGDGFHEIHVNTQEALVFIALMAKTSSWNFSGKIASIFSIF